MHKSKISSFDNNHEIEITIIDDIGWFNINKLDYENIKTFLYLVKKIMNIYNNNKVKYIKQYINEESKSLFKNSSIFEVDENTYIVNTPIEMFIEELIYAIGIVRE